MHMNREPMTVTELLDGWWAVAVPGIAHVVDLWVEEVAGRPEVLGIRVRCAPAIDFFSGERVLPYDPDTDDPGEVPAKVYWRWDADKRREFVESHDRPAVTGDLLRSLPLARMKLAVLEIRNDPFAFGPTPSRLAAGGGLSEQFLESIAEAYRRAVAAGLHPLVTIAESEQVSKPTASKWVAMARERGLLGYPSRPGLPGDSSTESPWRNTKRSAGRPKSTEGQETR
jgi:hypothetical protein